MPETKDTTDFFIARDGTWFHDGAEMTRKAIAKLFSDRALRVDEEGIYWLQTPYEKYPVAVADVPFVIVDYIVDNSVTIMISNMDEQVRLSQDTVYELRDGVPYVEVRDGLMARLSRAVLANLIHAHGEAFESGGRRFPLGEVS